MLVSPMRTYTVNESTKSASLCLPKSIYPASVRPISGSSIFATPWTGRRLSSKNLKTPSRTTQSGALFLQVMQHSTISAASCRLIRDVGQCSHCQQGQVSTVDVATIIILNILLLPHRVILIFRVHHQTSWWGVLSQGALYGTIRSMPKSGCSCQVLPRVG